MVLTPGDQVALFPHVYTRLGYDVLRDFAPVSTVCMVQFLWVVGPLVPAQVKTLADFVAWCRDNPKLASYGSPGEGTRPHFMGVSFARAAGVEMANVPYKGAPPIVQDLLAGQIAAAPAWSQTFCRTSRRASYAHWRPPPPQRAMLLPQVPTAREAGYPALEGVEWFGLFVPVSTPAEIVSRLNALVRESLDSEAVKTSLAKQSFEPSGCTPLEFAELIKSDLERWAAIVTSVGFKPADYGWLRVCLPVSSRINGGDPHCSATLLWEDVCMKFFLVLLALLAMPAYANDGIITKLSNHSVPDTINRFEAAVKAREGAGFIVFTRIDHAAAGKQFEIEMRPRTVLIFGNPKLGTPVMAKTPLLAIDNPPQGSCLGG